MQDFWHLDEQLFRAVHVGLHSPSFDPLFLGVTYTGDGWQVIAIIAACLIPKTRRVGIVALMSWAIAGLFRLLFVPIVGRERPSNFLFSHALETITGRTSFPSGHTTTSFAIAVAVVLATRGTKAIWIGFLLILWACAVGFSRVYIGVHYPFDVVGGAAFGTLFACLVSMFLEAQGWLQPKSAEAQA